MRWPTWLRRVRAEKKQAERRLADLEQRQERVEAGMVKFRQENGFIRMVRESMGPVR